MISSVIILLVVCLNWASANEQATKLFREGNKLYEESLYEEAAKSYEVAVNEGIMHPTLYYNYANSLFRAEKLGKAILYYEKALKLAPGDKDIQNNLKFAMAHTIDKHQEPQQNILTKFLWYLHMGYSLNMALWAVLILFSGIFGFFIILIYRGQRTRLLLMPLIGLTVMVLLAWNSSILLRIKAQEAVRYGIVLQKSLEIYSGPGKSYQALAKVHEGTKFEIEEVTNGWAKVKLPDGSGGFVLYSELGKI